MSRDTEHKNVQVCDFSRSMANYCRSETNNASAIHLQPYRGVILMIFA